MNIFFDLDGTLIDISDKYYRAYKDLVKHYHGKPLPRSLFWRYKRSRVSTSDLLSKSALSAVSAEKFSDMFMEALESKKYCVLDRLFPFTIRCLSTLIKRNHTLHLVSARHNKKNALFQISAMGLTPFFTSIYVGKMHKNGHVAKRIAIQPKLAGRKGPFAVVGDTKDEIEAARELGGISIVVLSGVRNKKLLSSYRPDYIIKDIRQVVSIIP